MLHAVCYLESSLSVVASSCSKWSVIELYEQERRKMPAVLNTALDTDKKRTLLKTDNEQVWHAQKKKKKYLVSELCTDHALIRGS